MLSKLDAALHYASLGWPIFPCGPDEPGCDPKASVLDGWQRDPRKAGPGELVPATTDPDLIRELWGRQPNANIGFCPEFAGFLVVDIDVKHDPSTLERWDACRLDKKMPLTLRAITPSGGRHEYYRGSGRSSVGVIVPGLDVDTRGVSGYVLLPPSTVEGKCYVWDQQALRPDFDLAVSLPAWISIALQANRQTATTGEFDKPVSIHRAALRLQQRATKGEVAISGMGGNNETYKVFAELASFNLSPQKSFDLVSEHWNPFCVPPWDDEALLTFARNAGKYASGKGIYTTDVKEAFKEHISAAESQRDALAEAKRIERAEYGALRNWSQQLHTPAPVWTIDGFILDRTVNILFGPSGTFKSTLAVDVGLSIACAAPTFGAQISKPGPVIYFAYEDAHQLMTSKREAWALGRGHIPMDDDYFVVPDPPLVTDIRNNDPGAWGPILDEVRERCPEPRLVIIDTMAKALGKLDENSAGDAGQFTDFCYQLVKIFGCSVLAIAHTGKDPGRGIRGSSAFAANVDGVFEANRPDKGEFVTVHCRKLRGAPERQAPWVFRVKGIGPGTVPFPADLASVPTSLARNDKIDAAAVGAALKRLGADCEAKAVTTYILACEMIEDPDLDPVTRRGRAQQIDVKLRRQTKGNLKPYAHYVQEGNSYLWRLPEVEAV